MDQKQAWEGLFSLNPPAGFDFDSAANVLDGVQEIQGVNLAAPVLKRAREFLMDPADFIAANPGDARVPQWTRLAASLGVTIAPTTASSSTAPPAATPPTTAPPATTSPPPPAAAKSLSPSGLRKAMLAAAAGPSLAGIKVATGTTPGGPSAKTDDPSDGGKPSTEPPQPKAVKKPDATGDADGDAGATTSEPPDDGHRSSAGDTGGHTRSSQEYQRPRNTTSAVIEVLRELAAITGVATDQAEVDEREAAESSRREKRLAADAAERERLQAEDEAALKRRLAIGNTAELKRRRSLLKIADEQRLADEEAAERKRRADEEAAERKRRADEEAEERKLRRKDEAEDRKRLADLARERAQAEDARPRQSRVAASVPLAVLETLRSAPYLASRDRALELARRAREGDASARIDRDALALQLRRDVRSMAPEYQVVASAELLLSLIEQVEAGRDQADSAWFRANFITGCYT